VTGQYKISQLEAIRHLLAHTSPSIASPLPLNTALLPRRSPGSRAKVAVRNEEEDNKKSSVNKKVQFESVAPLLFSLLLSPTPRL
jgi:hypothetical protein